LYFNFKYTDYILDKSGIYSGSYNILFNMAPDPIIIVCGVLQQVE